MDSSLFPAEIAVKHVIHHKFVFELGPSITGLGRGLRNTIVALVLIRCSCELLQAVINNRPWRSGPPK